MVSIIFTQYCAAVVHYSPRISAIFRAGSSVCGGYGMFRFTHLGIGPSDPDRA